MGPKHIGVTNLIFQDHVTIRFAVCYFLLVLHRQRGSISNGFRDICVQIYLGHDLDLSGSHDVTSLVTWRLDTPGAISYRCSIVAESLSAAHSRDNVHGAPKISGSWPWLFKVMWCHRSRDQSIRQMPFPIRVSLELSSIFNCFSRYPAPNPVCTHARSRRYTLQLILYAVPCMYCIGQAIKYKHSHT